jgi:hypothetical protein
MMDSLERGLAELRADLSPSSADKARLRALILAPALAGNVEPSPAPPAKLDGWAALKAAGTAGLKAGALLLGVGLGAGFWLGRETSLPATRAPAAIEAAPSPSAVARAAPAAPPPAPPATPGPLETRQVLKVSEPSPLAEPRRPPPRARATRKAVAPNPLNEELALLRRVERALRNGDPALALALLGELDERFPESRLVEERQAAKLMAHCRQGSADAVARAHAFLHDSPASVYRQRVQSACGLDAAVNARPRRAPAMKDATSPDTSGR